MVSLVLSARWWEQQDEGSLTAHQAHELGAHQLEVHSKRPRGLLLYLLERGYCLQMDTSHPQGSESEAPFWISAPFGSCFLPPPLEVAPALAALMPPSSQPSILLEALLTHGRPKRGGLTH